MPSPNAERSPESGAMSEILTVCPVALVLFELLFLPQAAAIKATAATGTNQRHIRLLLADIGFLISVLS
jgi:hypothetical protein